MKKVELIERKTMLYKTNVEYGDYTMNHVLGCSHGCRYPCYAYLMAKRFKKINSYQEWIRPRLVVNTLEILEKEIPKLINKIESVHLCFTTDPFMNGYNEVCNMSFLAIEKLNNAGIKCSILTKGLLPEKLSTYSRTNEYGITLISLDENYRKSIEPGAAPYKDRLIALDKIHQKGFKTWVSVEPYPTPNIIDQDLSTILNNIGFVDKIIFGRTNYNPKITAFPNYKNFYNEQALKVIDFCKKYKIAYHIKNKTISTT